MTPYYEHAGIQIFHGDCRELIPQLPEVDSVFADPPYGVGKAEWDARYWSEWMVPAAIKARFCLAVTPGIANLPLLPFSIGEMVYRWMMSLRILNNTTRGALGFGNWIACALYARPLVGVCTSSQDCAEVAIRGVMPDHPSPKPYEAMLWLIERIPGESFLDPFCGSGTTLVAAKARENAPSASKSRKSTAKSRPNGLVRKSFNFRGGRQRVSENCEHPQCCICLKRECQQSAHRPFQKHGSLYVCGGSCLATAVKVAYQAACSLGSPEDKPCGKRESQR